jgi:hypothetical protein
VAYYAVGDYWQGLDCMRQAIALLPGELYSSRFALPVLPAVLARGYVAWGLAELGDFGEAASMGEDAVRRGGGEAHQYFQCAVVCWFGLSPPRRRPHSDPHTRTVPGDLSGYQHPSRPHKCLPPGCGVCPGRAHCRGPATPGSDAGARDHREPHVLP